nr:hypothetical protein [Tanacetum cinerariifolium]
MEMEDTLSSCSNSEAQQMQETQDRAKKSCMVSFRQLHSHLKRLSQNDLQGSRTEFGFKRAFATIFGQDIETFIGTMFLNMSIMSRVYLNDEYVAMTRNYFIQYTQQTILEFRDTLIQHLESVKKSTDERVQLKREYDSWVNKRQMQKTEEKVDTSKALDANIKPIYDEEPMAKVQTTAKINVFAIGQQHTEQLEFNNEGEVSSKNMLRFSSNDMVHNHYLEEAKKKTQERSRNLEPSLLPSARSRSTANGSKPKPRINNQTSRNWLASKSSFAMTNTVPIAEHSRNSRIFSDSKHFVCSTCQKCVFSANHDSCLTKFLKEVNSRAKVPSNKTPNRNKPIEKISVPNKQERQIPTGHRFSIKKTFVVQKKTMTPRSCLRWKQTGKIFKTVGLRWVPTGKIFTSSTTKVESEPLNVLNADITNQYECEQTLDVSAGTLNLSAGTSFNPKEEGVRVWLLKRQISHKLGLQGIFI